MLSPILARVPLTIRHGIIIPEASGVNELDAAGWDVVRATETPFGFASVDAQIDRVRPRAHRIAEIARALDAQRLCSYGVGTGIVERQLLELGFDLTVTEYAPETTERLRSVFPQVVEHDLRDGPLAGFDLHLLHRVDTELSDAEWRRYLAAIAEPHLMVVSELVDWTTLKRELHLQRKRLMHRSVINAGWLRTDARMRSILPGGSERLEVFDLPGFLVA